MRTETEETFTLAGREGEPGLLVRHRPGPGPSVLYVHGSTFPSGLSIAYPIDGRSWMDDLQGRGFDVWAFDIAGYGGSEPWPAHSGHGDAPWPGRASAVERQIERVVRRIRADREGSRVSIIAHSWGSIPAALFAGQWSPLIDRLVLFAPIAQRAGPGPELPSERFALITAAEQRAGFDAGKSDDQIGSFPEALFQEWVSAYLATDLASGTRTPPAVAVPSGWGVDLAEAWSGRLPYDPAAVKAPTLIVRGAWDPITRDTDAAWLVEAMRNVPGGVVDHRLCHGGHRVHLETGRADLFNVIGAFLSPSSERAQP